MAMNGKPQNYQWSRKNWNPRTSAIYMLLNTEWTLTLRSIHPTRPEWKARAHDFGAKSLVFIPSSEEIRVTSKDCYIFGHCSIFPRCADRRCPASELEKSSTKKNCCCIEPGNRTRARFSDRFRSHVGSREARASQFYCSRCRHRCILTHGCQSEETRREPSVFARI